MPPSMPPVKMRDLSHQTNCCRGAFPEMLRILIVTLLLLSVGPSGCRMSSTSRTLPNDVSGPGQVTVKATPGDHYDVLVDGKVATRYMYAHDTSTPERRAQTYKPYLHVFDEDGTAPITN